jgi:hypothetical protein
MPHIRRFFSRNLTNVSILKVCYLSIENIKQTNNNNNKKVSINNLAKLIMKRERERSYYDKSNEHTTLSFLFLFCYNKFSKIKMNELNLFFIF